MTSTTMLGTRNASSPEIRGPRSRDTAKSRPSVGTARTEFVNDTNQRARPVCPTHSPSGIATAAASTTVSSV